MLFQKVTCLSNTGCEKTLTVGAQYDLLSIEQECDEGSRTSVTNFKIKDEDDYMVLYPADLFSVPVTAPKVNNKYKMPQRSTGWA